MSDPVRWGAPDGGASDEVRAMLRHARRPAGLDAAARARNAAVVQKIAATPVATATAVGAKLVAKIGLAALVAVTASTAALRARAPRPQVVARAHTAAPVATPPARAETAPVVDTPVTVSPVAVAPVTVSPVTAEPVRPRRGAVATPTHDTAARVEPTPEPAAVVAQPAETAQPVETAPSIGGAITPHTVPPREDPLVYEAGMLQSASAVLASDPREALSRLDRHEREFPHGQLAAEREFLAVDALRALGRHADARARAEALVSRFPASPYAARARRLLDAMP